MIEDPQRRQAEALRKLHRGGELFVLPNAWDALSARLFEDAGFQAIGTTSAGVAASLGYPDGQRLPFERMLEATGAIAHAVALPVSADIEAGYGDDAAAVLASVQRVVLQGAVGINLEDGTNDPQAPLMDRAEHCERIRAIRHWADEEGIALVVNARTDVYWLGVGEPETRLPEAVGRANAYRDAGADCIFIPGASDEALIEQLVQAVDAPLNVLAGPQTPDLERLAVLGVTRLSLGSGPIRMTLRVLADLSADLLGGKGYQSYFAEALPYPALQQLLARGAD